MSSCANDGLAETFSQTSPGQGSDPWWEVATGPAAVTSIVLKCPTNLPSHFCNVRIVFLLNDKAVFTSDLLSVDSTSILEYELPANTPVICDAVRVTKESALPSETLGDEPSSAVFLALNEVEVFGTPIQQSMYIISRSCFS